MNLKLVIKPPWEAQTLSSAWMNYRKINKTNPTTIVIYLYFWIFGFLFACVFGFFSFLFKDCLWIIALFFILPFLSNCFGSMSIKQFILRTSLILFSKLYVFQIPTSFFENIIKTGLRNWEEEAKETFNQNVERSLYMWCMAPSNILSILIFEQSNLKK